MVILNCNENNPNNALYLLSMELFDFSLNYYEKYKKIAIDYIYDLKSVLI